MERALIGRAVAKAADRHRAISHDLGGQRAAAGNGLTGADNAVSAQMVHLLHVRDVHGAALTFAIAGLLAEQLRHRELGVRAARDRMTVTTMSGCKIILRADGGERACLGALLADAQMDVARVR